MVISDSSSSSPQIIVIITILNINLDRVAKALVGHCKRLRFSAADHRHSSDPTASPTMGWLIIMILMRRVHGDEDEEEKEAGEDKKQDEKQEEEKAD